MIPRHHRISWAAENRLVRMVANSTIGPTNRIEFGYDWRSRRMSKRVWNNKAGTGNPTNDLKFVYDGWNLVASLNANNNAVVQSFVWGTDLAGSQQGAGGVGGLIALNDTASGMYFVAFDGNGNVAGLVKGTDGSVGARFEYASFGEVIRVTGPISEANPFRFSTKFQDNETDLLNFGYRYYHANTGRWLTRDPLEEKGGPNLFKFVSNNPLNQVDLLGLVEVWFEKNRRRGISGPVAGGEWSQPGGIGRNNYGEGRWRERDTSLANWIHLWSGPEPGGICNSISATLPYPDSPDDHENTNPNAGAFSVHAKDKCGGQYRLYFDVQMTVRGRGWDGNAAAKIWLHGRGYQTVKVQGGQPEAVLAFGTFVDVTLGNKKVTVLQYTPTISFATTSSTPLSESQGWAFGRVKYLRADKL
jgi:RHS repeat-associated protein